MQNSYDILIVGGGMVGATLALALAQQTSLSIAIIEANAPPTLASINTLYHHRVSAIALASVRIFKALGVWEDIQKKRVSPFVQIDVWDANSNGEVHFHSQEIAESVLGYIIENTVLQTTLYEKILQQPQIKFISPIKLAHFQENENGVALQTADGCNFNAKLAVAADGAQSWLRTQAGIGVDLHHYEQEAIVATVRTAQAHHQIARQVFLNTGPLAFLPLAEAHLSSIVWSLPVTLANEHMTLSIDEFKLRLAQAFSHRLGDILEVESRHTFPLSKQQAKHYVKSHVVLVGDAAHTIHPLAGQGVNMGLLDAASLAEIIAEQTKKCRPFASAPALRAYERWRKADNMGLLVGVDIIKQIFQNQKKPISQLRSLGLQITNKTQWLKSFFTHHAVGNRTGLPKIAQ